MAVDLYGDTGDATRQTGWNWPDHKGPALRVKRRARALGAGRAARTHGGAVKTVSTPVYP